MQHMRKASVRDLHIRTSELVSAAAEGAVITIERRGQPVAELRPISRKSRARHLPELTELRRRFPSVESESGRFLEEGR